MVSDQQLRFGMTILMISGASWLAACSRPDPIAQQTVQPPPTQSATVDQPAPVSPVSVVPTPTVPSDQASARNTSTAAPADVTIEPIELQLSDCGRSCPTLEIARVQSAFPALDTAVDTFIAQYMQSLIAGLDVPTLLPNDTTPQSARTDQQDTPQSQLQKQIHTPVRALTQLNQLNQGYGSSNTLTVSIKPQLLPGVVQTPTITVLMEAYSYTGGAHGSSQQTFLTLDIEHKRLLKLDDVIVSGQRARLSALARQAFVQWVKESQPDSELKDYLQFWPFQMTSNFYLSADGLVLQYGEYEIGPYAVGLPRLTIPYADLQGIIKPVYLPSETAASREKPPASP